MLSNNKEVDQQHLQVQTGPRNSWHLVWDQNFGTVEGTSSRPLLKRKRPKSFQGCQPSEKPYLYILSLFRLRVRVIPKRRVELPDLWPDWPHLKLQVLDPVFIVTTVVLNPSQTLQLKFPQVFTFFSNVLRMTHKNFCPWFHHRNLVPKKASPVNHHILTLIPKLSFSILCFRTSKTWTKRRNK